MNSQEPQIDSATLDLGNGEELTFTMITAWDLIAVKRELGVALADADPFESSMAFAWRSAVNGGFEGDLEQFCRIIPTPMIADLTAIVKPFLGKSEGDSAEAE